MKLLKQFIVHWQPVLALEIIIIFSLVAICAPLVVPTQPLKTVLPFRIIEVNGNRLPHPPDSNNLLGTIPTGRGKWQADVYYTLIWGSRSALAFGLTGTLIAGIFGSIVGAFSSYLGGKLGQSLLRVTDAFLAFPIIAGIALFGPLVFPPNSGSELSTFQSILGDLGIDNVMLALVCFSWMPYTRIIYSDMECIRRAEFILAAQAVGVTRGRIILRHLIPNSISNVIVLATRDVGGLVLMQATFSFIGLGSGSPWGSLLAMGRTWILGEGGNPLQYWWVFLPITTALVCFGLGWNLLGDVLNDWFNPRLRNFKSE